MEDRDKEYYRNLYTLASVGINIVAATFIGLGMGWLIDNKIFHGRTSPWFTLIFLLFGIIAGFRNVFSIVHEKGGQNDAHDKGQGEGQYDSRGDGDNDSRRGGD